MSEILSNLTSLTFNSTYFGRDIFDILDFIDDMLDRQESEINSPGTRGNNNRFDILMNASKFGAEIVDNLISSHHQWDQLKIVST